MVVMRNTTNQRQQAHAEEIGDSKRTLLDFYVPVVVSDQDIAIVSMCS